MKQITLPPNVAEVQLSYSSKVKAADRVRISGSKDAESIFRTALTSDMEYREAFWVLYMNRANRVLGAHMISLGGIAGTVADPKIIFQGALLTNSSGVILCHNHPSGNLTASQADIDLTKKLKEAGKMLEIQVLDHLIMTEEKYFSFADEGLL